MAFKIDMETLLRANGTGELILLGVADVAPKHGGISAKAYGFRIGERQTSLTVEIYEQEGRA